MTRLETAMPISTGQLALRRSFNNVNGSQNTAVGAGAGPNLAAGFNNTYVGQLRWYRNVADSTKTVRSASATFDGNGAGSGACYIGGIFNNAQPVGGSVVVVTLDLAYDQLGFDAAAGQGW